MAPKPEKRDVWGRLGRQIREVRRRVIKKEKKSVWARLGKTFLWKNCQQEILEQMLLRVSDSLFKLSTAGQVYTVLWSGEPRVPHWGLHPVCPAPGLGPAQPPPP